MMFLPWWGAVFNHRIQTLDTNNKRSIRKSQGRIRIEIPPESGIYAVLRMNLRPFRVVQ
jgi:hypothetical protein